MKKSRAAVILAAMVLVLGVLAYTSIEGWGMDSVGSASRIKLGLDLAGGVSITYEVAGEETPSAEDMKDTVYKLQKRVGGYSTEAQVYQEGSDRISIEIPGVSDANTILEDLGSPGSLYFIAQTDAEGNQNYTYDYTSGYYLLKTIDEMLADGSIVLTGTDVKDAQARQRSSDLGVSEAVVTLEFTPEGTTKFAAATQAAYTAGQSIAIYYDGELISVPQVNAVITDGSAEISGQSSFDEADRLASTIRIGGLKLELKELRSNVVGAQLGSEAISTSLKAGVIGFVLVIIFMIVVYYIPGFAASLALTIYVGLVIACLNFFEITLTLPGIAGIILSIGMAVDANVIIYARVREELYSGKTVSSAIKIGFEKALSAIVDGNVTTLIAAIVLGLKGTGPVKGFAQTLALGIVLSMFTALVVSKLIINALYALGLKDARFYGVGKEKKTIRFLSKRWVFIGISAVIAIVGIVFMGVNKSQTGGIFNYSLEFMGGTSTTVTFNEDYTIEELDAQVVPYIEEITGDGNVQMQKVKDSNQVIIKTRTLSVEERETLDQRLQENFGVDPSITTAESISSTISSEMTKDAIVALALATICMLIYIWFRFKDIRFATSAVLALLHDVVIVVIFYAISKVLVGGTFIACILTVIGYSVNSTIVIFDRIRENMILTKKADTEELVDRSISQTLTRNIYTTLTTLIMVIVLYILGVTSVKEFALPLIVGIVAGAYSSICITGAVWFLFKKKIVKKETAKR